MFTGYPVPHHHSNMMFEYYECLLYKGDLMHGARWAKLNAAPDRNLLQVMMNFSLPDVDAAEHREDQPEDERHGHGQQRGQQPVEDEFDQLKRGVASYPHFVEAVSGDGLCDDIFETNLSGHTSQGNTHNEL